jgi:hypothetical protein
VRFAIANKHDEHRPWAIIIIRAPCQPQGDSSVVPIIIKDMCPIEE